VNCIVFSRDRAMQLDAFLASIERYARSIFSSVTVLYRPTSEGFEEAYDVVAGDRPWAGWRRERDFRSDLVEAVGDHDMTVFHTDDDVYFRPPPPVELRDDEVCFALRLGLNTTYCYPLDLQEQLVSAVEDNDRVSWDWRAQGLGAYSYPLAVNGHVFRTAEVRSWLTGAEYANPNELEAALQGFNDRVRPRMASPRHNVVVSIPANVVNETYPNRNAEAVGVVELNTRFLAGDRIDTGAMDFSDVGACHQEIAYVYRRTA
jgi:hypothetical protein